MSSQSKTGTDSFRYIWKIENFSLCSFIKGDYLRSPIFVTQIFDSTEWHLSLAPRGAVDTNCIALYLNREYTENGPKSFTMSYEMSVLTTEGRRHAMEFFDEVFVKGTLIGTERFLDRKQIFENMSVYLPQDELTLLCDMKRSKRGSDSSEITECFARSRVHVDKAVFTWSITDFSVRPLYKIYGNIPVATKYKLPIEITLFIRSTDKGNVAFRFCKWNNSKPVYMKSEMRIQDIKKNSHPLAIGECLLLPHEKEWTLSSLINCNKLEMEKYLYSPDNILTIQCEFLISAGIILHEIQEMKISASKEISNLNCMNSLTSALHHLYLEKRFCDVCLQVEKKTLKAHKVVLCARSPVFSAMFENDMKEKESGMILINDMDEFTLTQMLHFLYFGTLSDLQFDTALKLFAAADKYEIISLSETCSSFIKSSIVLTNFCEVLILGDTHQNDGLKASVEDFIRKHMHEALKSDSWKELMDTNFQLAIDTLRKVLNPTSCL